MPHRRARVLIGLGSMLALAAGVGQADVFNMPAGDTSLQLVTVGDPGNSNSLYGSGAVPYIYAIGKYDVTAAQYTAFLNAVAASDPYNLYNTSMGVGESPGMRHRPQRQRRKL